MNALVKSIIFFIFHGLFISLHPHQSPWYLFNRPMNFVTVADTEHFPWVMILLKSIAEHTKHVPSYALVFDLGLKAEEIAAIESCGAKVCAIERVHPDITKKFVVNSQGRLVRGWYAWKPVAMKQALEYFPYFLYIDAGRKLIGPVDEIFLTIFEEGYFFLDTGHTIRPTVTQKVKDMLHLDMPQNNWMLDELSIDAGVQGISEDVYEDYIKPLYTLAHRLEYFEDDGTAPWGFGGARHDQTLFSIQARMLDYKVHKACGFCPFRLCAKKTVFNNNVYFQHKNLDDNPRARENHLE